MQTEADDTRPRLVFFRWVSDDLPEFIRIHLQEHVDCLARFFDVVLIDEDCDYAEICDRYEPDLTLFESGVYVAPRKVTNTAAHPQIPKLGFLHSDAYCTSRTAFLSDMARWGVETFFTMSVAAAEYTPEIADRLFVWPNFVDAGRYHDYGEAKVIPVLLTGSQAMHYPWRNRISRVVAQQYPTLTTPHLGWSGRDSATRMVQGEQYARMINASLVVPTCGTVAKEVVRKHFEIPAAKSLLITERAASIEAAGFVDMVNCVFADTDDIIDKLDHLFQHPDELALITQNGYELAQSAHTAAQRDQILQWYRLNRQRRPGQHVVQPGPFQPLELVDSSGMATNGHPISGGVDRRLLARGDALRADRRYQEAQVLYLRCLNYNFMAEPLLRLGLCSLGLGDPGGAIGWLTKSLSTTLDAHQAADPDPLEWACYIRAFICQGKLDKAEARAAQFPDLRHLELDRIAAVLRILRGGPASIPDARQQPPGARSSLQSIPVLDTRAWVAELVDMLRACAQTALADRLAGQVAATADQVSSNSRSTSPGAVVPIAQRRAVARRRPAPFTPWHVRLERRVKAKLRPILRKPDNDELLTALTALAQKEECQAALFLGSSAGSRMSGVLAAGLRSSPSRPALFRLTTGPERSLTVDENSSGIERNLPGGPAIEQLQTVCAVDHFDLVVVQFGGDFDPADMKEAEGAWVIVATGINTIVGYELTSALVDDRRYRLQAHNPEHGDGYAIFRRIDSSVGDSNYPSQRRVSA